MSQWLPIIEHMTDFVRFERKPDEKLQMREPIRSFEERRHHYSGIVMTGWPTSSQYSRTSDFAVK